MDVPSTKTRWNSIDCLKGISCIAVVCIHYNFTGGSLPAQLSLIMKAMCRFAVPVFLCISGFFAYNEPIDPEKYVRKIKHTLNLLLIAALFYAVFARLWYPMMHDGWTVRSFLGETITGTKVVKFFLTNDPFVYSHLWYLLALLYCYLFVLLVPKCAQYACFLAPALLIGYAGMQEFHIFRNSVQLEDMTSRVYLYNLFLFRALPFFLFGMIFRRKLATIQRHRIRKPVLALIAVSGSVCAVAESFLWGNSQFYVGNYITVFAMFLYALKFPDAAHPVLLHIGRDLSVYVYLFHIAVGKAFDFLGSYAGFWGKNLWYILRPPAVLAGALLFAELIFRGLCLIKKEKMPCPEKF